MWEGKEGTGRAKANMTRTHTQGRGGGGGRTIALCIRAHTHMNANMHMHARATHECTHTPMYCARTLAPMHHQEAKNGLQEERDLMRDKMNANIEYVEELEKQVACCVLHLASCILRGTMRTNRSNGRLGGSRDLCV